MPFVSGFRPSSNAFTFTNSWPQYPVKSIPLTGPISIPVGSASNGLCGGMVFAVRDYYEAGEICPSGEQPKFADVLFDYIVNRLIDSFGVIKLPFPAWYDYLPFMQALDADAAMASLSYWPLIKADIDADRLSTLGIVTVYSLWIGDVGFNHQALVYGYQQAGTSVTLFVYDPNSADSDKVTIGFDEAAPGNPIQSNIVVPRVRAFFPVQYSQVSPPDIEDARLIGAIAPTQLSAGADFYYQASAQNTGSTTWSATNPPTFLLGSQLPQDNTDWGTGRIPIPYDVPPRKSVNISATLNPPDVVGPTNMGWQMVHEGVRWFGNKAVNQIVVGENPQCTAIRSSIAQLRRDISALRSNLDNLDPRTDQELMRGIRKNIAQSESDISTLRSNAANLGCGPVN